MQTARQMLLNFLKENGGSAPFNAVELKLSHSGILGMGVESIDVVHAAARDGLVNYNPTTRIVSLVEKDIAVRGKFQKVLTSGKYIAKVKVDKDAGGPEVELEFYPSVVDVTNIVNEVIDRVISGHYPWPEEISIEIKRID